MERKIGEIFEFSGEWYQCLEEKTCTCFGCDFRDHKCDNINLQKIKGNCMSGRREDNRSVIFKKLEKVGEPSPHYCPSGRIIYFQRYKLFYKLYSHNTEYIMCDFNEDGIVSIEIKQNKEDMEEKEQNLKPFDLEAAKSGKPVCTRDGRKARVICFDRDWDMHIVALVADPLGESVHYYLSNGKVDFDKQNGEDLMMLPEKKEGWVNVYKERVYSTKEEAIKAKYGGATYVDTVKIEWEE